MRRTTHVCSLRKTDRSGFPQLAPNASCWRKLTRRLRKLLALNPNTLASKIFFRNKSTMVAEQKRYANSPYVFVLHPFSSIVAVQDIIFLLVWTWQFLYLPFRFTFPLVNWTIPFENVIIRYVQLVLILIFFIRGYVENTTKAIVISPKKIVSNYLKKYFMCDSLTLICGLVLRRFRNINSTYELFIDLFDLIGHLLRWNSIIVVLRQYSQSVGISNSMQSVITHLFLTVVILHIFTCVLYAIPVVIHEDQTSWPSSSWFVKAKIDNYTASNLDIYTECFLTVICYILGASHKMYSVTLLSETIPLTFVMVFGRLYSLYVLADLLKMFGVVGVAETKYEQYLVQLRQYMNSKNLPTEMKTKLLTYYEYKLQRRYFSEHQFLSTLSNHLKTELFIFGARKLIEKARVLKSLPMTTLEAIIALMKSETFLPNDYVVRRGNPAEHIYFVGSGTIAIINKNGTELSHLTDGDEFGICVISDSKSPLYEYSFVAVETSDIYYMNKKRFYDILQQHVDVLKYFENSLKRRAEELNKIEEKLNMGGDDVLSELQAGKILENLHRRAMHFE